MTSKEYQEQYDNIIETMVSIMRAKNNDYAGSADPFHNFRMVEKYNLMPTEFGIFTRMSDKLSRLANFLRTGLLLVPDEKVDDTLIDLANYSIILAILLREKREEGELKGTNEVIQTG